MQAKTKKAPTGAKKQAIAAKLKQVQATRSLFLAQQFTKSLVEIEGNTNWEELECIGYNPETSQLEAVVSIKQTTGYNSPLCGIGSTEYVRFFVDYEDGSGWHDAGVTSFAAYNIPTAASGPQHPIRHTVFVRLDDEPFRKICQFPVMPKVRGVLSWNKIPSDDPNQAIAFGNRLDAHIILKRKEFLLKDIFKIKDGLEQLVPLSLLDNTQLTFPQAKVNWKEILPIYKADNVPETRISYETVVPLINGNQIGVSTPTAFDPELIPLLDLDINALSQTFLEPAGNTSYEELVCVGLNTQTDTLSAVFKLKRPKGYSGDFCKKGSTEYISFWADWNNNGFFEEYLGTRKIQVYDLDTLPAEGIHYSVQLPIGKEIAERLRSCDQPQIVSIRAVLSWGTKSPSVNPNKLPFWGDRLDSLVRVRYGSASSPGELVGSIYQIGGVATNNIDSNTFLAIPGANSRDTNRPFGGIVKITGNILNTGLPGETHFRVEFRPQGTEDWAPVTTKQLFRLKNNLKPSDEPLNEVVQNSPDGWFEYLETEDKSIEDINQTLSHWQTGTRNGAFDIRLAYTKDHTHSQANIQYTGVKTIMVDNDGFKHNPNDPRSEVDNSQDLDLVIDGGDCKLYEKGVGTIKGHLRVRDTHFSHWKLTLEPRSSFTGAIPIDPKEGVVKSAEDQGPEELAWELNTENLKVCGYTVHLVGYDRAIMNSNLSGRHRAHKSVGFAIVPKGSLTTAQK